MLTEILKNQNKLRPGQLGALLALQSHFLGVHRNTVAQVHLPTGYGKTLVMLLAQQLFSDNGQTWVVCGKDVLREQLVENFQALYGEHPIEILPPSGAIAREITGARAPLKGASPAQVHLKKGLTDASIPPRGTKVVVSTPTSLANYSPVSSAAGNGSSGDAVKLILIDEGHHQPAKTWSAIIAKNPAARVILFTATPFRRDLQQLAGRMVFSYALADAVDESAVADAEIHRLVFTPKGTESAQKAHQRKDELVAKACIQLVSQLRIAHPDAAALIKCNTVARARQLEATYQALLTGQPKGVLALHSKLGQTERCTALGLLKKRDYSVLISVEMLAEGFDHDNICVLAVHDRIADFSHFVQVAGRVTRSVSGRSDIVVCESDMPLELASNPQMSRLRDVSDALRSAVLREELRSELLTSMEDGEIPSGQLQAAMDKLQLGRHALVLAVDNKPKAKAAPIVFPSAPAVFGKVEVIGSHTESLPMGEMWVGVIRTPDPQRWLGDLDTLSVRHGLLLAYAPNVSTEVKRRVVFISASSDHRPCAHDLVKEIEKSHKLRPVALKDLKSAYSKPDRVSYYNVGLRSRLPSPLVERYRIITGNEVEIALDGETARGFNQGHLMGKLFTTVDGAVNTEVLGVSSSGVVWAAGTTTPRELCSTWLQNLAELVTSGSKPRPTALERLPATELLNIGSLTKAAGLLGVWGSQSIERQLKLFGGGSTPWEMTLSDACITSIQVIPADGKITFRLQGTAQLEAGGAVAVDELIEQTDSLSMFEVSPELEVEMLGGVGRTTLCQHLKMDPPLLYLQDGSTVQGMQHAPPLSGMSFEFLKGTLFVADWSKCNTNIEKPANFEPAKTKRAPGVPSHVKPTDYDPADDTDNSIFKLVAQELMALVSKQKLDFVVCDDDSYEMADFIAGKKTSANTALIQFYLCKRTLSPPGIRSEDVAELWSQALRTSQILTPEALLVRFRERKLNRMKLTPAVDKSKCIAEDLLKPGMDVTFEVILVQPGIDVAKLQATKPGSPGPKATINHAFVSMAAIFQRRGVRLLVVGDVGNAAVKTAARKSTKAGPVKVPAPSSFADIFKRPFV
ncbi:DEAD/DEAH box helicase [Achromobacter mucicolens]|uniref:DEAD/DEAH box helicase n=1 Tax=Achromobacter mucicolens TaxID=1389922 RepID=UPI00158312AF|nr:DEAD/DEAH box helicase family protein [Achromobacter mucicolens]